MVIKPMIRNNICMNAHPAGCDRYVSDEIDYVRSQGPIQRGPKKVLVIGSSTGYGLSSRITAAFGCGAGTIGIAFEREGSEKRTGTAGYYNTRSFERQATEAGLFAESINDDAFSDGTKQKTIDLIGRTLGSVELVVYSLASPVRTDPESGEMYRSALKPIGRAYSARSIDPFTRNVIEVTAEPATDEEIAGTIKVMGGEDWARWIDALLAAGVLANGARTVAYSYIGPSLTAAIYREGTIGRAKEHLEKSAHELSKRLADVVGGNAFVAINKAVVTRSSAVIPVVPLYLAVLFKVMKQKGVHEDCVRQMHRLFRDRLYVNGAVPVDAEGRIRMDDWEMREDVQSEIDAIWPSLTSETIKRYGDLEQYTNDFLHMHGFGYDSVDYEADVDPT